MEGNDINIDAINVDESDDSDDVGENTTETLGDLGTSMSKGKGWRRNI